MPETVEQRRLGRALRRLGELRAWRNAREATIDDWSFSAREGQPVALRLGHAWPVVEVPVRLSGTGRVPEEWAGEPVEIELWLGGEGFVQLSTGLRTGLNAMHHRFPVVEQAEGGEAITIAAEVVPKGMFGSHVANPRVERAHLVVPHRAARALERDLTMLIEANNQLANEEVAPFLLDIVEAANVEWMTTWPTATDVSVSRYVEMWNNPIGSGVSTVPPSYGVEAFDVTPPAQGLWHLPERPRPLEPLPAEAEAGIARARQVIADGLERLKREYQPIGHLVLTGHAHIDLAWLWPVAETRRKDRRTFWSVLDLMERYEDFTFNQSSAQAYVWLQEDDPELLERIKERVAEGRWEPVGGSWLEPDCQVTGGEAFVRQLFYGQRTFEQLFGQRHTVAWLPDVFGFSGGIPQLLRGAGLESFFTIKLNWSEANQFPYDLFTWEGIDGSRVTAHTFFNPGHGYNGNLVPLDTLGTWRSFRGKRLHSETLLAFGWGDGGGGPTQRMLENYQRIKEFPGLPRLRMGRIDEFFARLPKDGLPVWVGELYLEYHRGTLTTQGKVKKLNREAEHRLAEAEVFGSLASLHGFSYPRERIDAAWKLLLLNQFHDILPGSSIHEVYEDAHRMLEEAVGEATEARDDALRHLAGAPGSAVLVANATLSPRPLTVLLPDNGAAGVVDGAGQPVPVQATEHGLLVHDPSRTVPGLGWTTLNRADGAGASVAAPVRAEGAGEGAVIESDRLRIEFGADGTIHRLTDKVAGRETLADRGNQLWAWVDKPRTYDAWDIEESYQEAGEEIDGVERVSVIEAGPLRASVRVERVWRDSRIVQTYRLLAGSGRLDVETFVDWHERMVYLQARFPLAVRTHEATYETMYGAVRRATHRNTSWEATRFEVSGHRFADLSETGFGVALLNDGKYGHGAHGNVLTLSLVRGPLYPDPFADEGEHRFTYSLFPHAGDWTEADVVNEAIRLNSPLVATAASVASDTAPLVEADGLPIALGAMKPADDGQGLILRVYEPHGARGTAILRFSRSVNRVVAMNLLEDPDPSGEDGIERDGDVVRIAMRPFQVRTVRVTIG
ncbi:MAG: alpha-mannosidase [Thermomicrobiales bacterium]